MAILTFNSQPSALAPGRSAAATGSLPGAQDDNESIAAIHRALDLGINWIDTAAVYGLGHSEEMVARAAESISHKPYVFTKCSLRWHEDRTIYHSLKAALAGRRAGSFAATAGRGDHRPLPGALAQSGEEIEEGWEALARLREQGKIRWIGVSNFNVEQMKRAQKIAPITSLQPPYSMLRRAIEEEILPLRAEPTASASSTTRQWSRVC